MLWVFASEVMCRGTVVMVICVLLL